MMLKKLNFKHQYYNLTQKAKFANSTTSTFLNNLSWWNPMLHFLWIGEDIHLNTNTTTDLADDTDTLQVFNNTNASNATIIIQNKTIEPYDDPCKYYYAIRDHYILISQQNQYNNNITRNSTGALENTVYTSTNGTNSTNGTRNDEQIQTYVLAEKSFVLRVNQTICYGFVDLFPEVFDYLKWQRPMQVSARNFPWLVAAATSLLELPLLIISKCYQ